MNQSQTIVVGVDATPESARAAALAWWMADRQGAWCQLVHAVQQPTRSRSGRPGLEPEVPLDILLKQARADIERVLAGVIPAPVLESLALRVGGPGPVINEAAIESKAGLVVVGGKYHSAIGRWLGGSTAHHMIRTAQVPVVIAGACVSRIERILVAVDRSDVAAPLLELAQQMARSVGAELTALHAIEPAPPTRARAAPQPDPASAARVPAELFERLVQTRVPGPDVTCVVGEGSAARVALDEALARQADLLIVAAHSDRGRETKSVGKTTAQLLDNLCTSVMVVPRSALQTEAPTHSAVLRRAGAKTLTVI